MEQLDGWNMMITVDHTGETRPSNPEPANPPIGSTVRPLNEDWRAPERSISAPMEASRVVRPVPTALSRVTVLRLGAAIGP